MIYNATLSYQPLAKQDEWQSNQLRHLLPYLQERSAFYRRQFAEHHINIQNIRTLVDLQFLPTTTKTDLQEHNLSFLCVQSNEVKEYTATSGTLGNPVTIALTEQDLLRLAYNEQQSFQCADGKPSDIYQLMLTLDRQFMAGMAYYLGIRQMGAALVRTGTGFPAMQWDTILRLQANSLVAVPSFLLKLIDHAKANGIDLHQTPVEKVICIGESLRNADFELNTLGEKIQEQWKVKLYNTYASTEMQTAFTECSAGMGGHQQPDLIILEILDDHGNQLQEGEYGEVTITTLGVMGMPLLRYRTGDICCYYESVCSCGRHSRRLSPVLGRKQQMIKYKGTTLYPPAIFDVLNELPFVSEYVVEAYTGELGTDELVVHVSTPLPEQECAAKLRPLLQSKLRVSPAISIHPAASLQQMQFPNGNRKPIKFIDNRKNAL